MNMNKNAGLSPSQRPVIVASNRGPVSLTRDEQDNQVIQRGSGGLVTALTGMARHIDMTWIACAQTPEDRAWEIKKGDGCDRPLFDAASVWVS